jgi:hypothetical protein
MQNAPRRRPLDADTKRRDFRFQWSAPLHNKERDIEAALLQGRQDAHNVPLRAANIQPRRNDNNSHRSVGQIAVPVRTEIFRLSMIFSENRFPLFGIML